MFKANNPTNKRSPAIFRMRVDGGKSKVGPRHKSETAEEKERSEQLRLRKAKQRRKDREEKERARRRMEEEKEELAVADELTSL